jgi:hypothetical protein
MWPSPPRPITPTFLPFVTHQWRMGENVVIPAQSNGAAPASDRVEIGVADASFDVYP